MELADRTRTYPCSLYGERIAARRHGKRLSDEEVRSLIDNGNDGLRAHRQGSGAAPGQTPRHVTQ